MPKGPSVAEGGASVIGGPGCRVSVGGVYALVEGAVSADSPPLWHSTPHWALMMRPHLRQRTRLATTETSKCAATSQHKHHGYIALAARSPLDLDSMEKVSVRTRTTNGHAPVEPDRLVTDHHEINHTTFGGIKQDGDMHLHVIVDATTEANSHRDDATCIFRTFVSLCFIILQRAILEHKVPCFPLGEGAWSWFYQPITQDIGWDTH